MKVKAGQLHGSWYLQVVYTRGSKRHLRRWSFKAIHWKGTWTE